jgi:hydrogenase large subunit
MSKHPTIAEYLEASGVSRRSFLQLCGMLMASAPVGLALTSKQSVLQEPVFSGHEVEGVGTHEAPRGTLSHWVVIKDEKIKNYQAVVPSTWNASPRDQAGAHGPYEASLLHTPLAQPEEPLEVLRTVHSFDPCMACACHAFDPSGRQIANVKML